MTRDENGAIERAMDDAITSLFLALSQYFDAKATCAPGLSRGCAQ